MSSELTHRLKLQHSRGFPYYVTIENVLFLAGILNGGTFFRCFGTDYRGVLAHRYGIKLVSESRIKEINEPTIAPTNKA